MRNGISLADITQMYKLAILQYSDNPLHSYKTRVIIHTSEYYCE